MVLTGVRVTELVTLTVGNVSLSTGAHIKVVGKFRIRNFPIYSGTRVMPNRGRF
jgi:hypothetical protein